MTEHSLEETGNKVEQASNEPCCSATAWMASEMDLASTVLFAGAASLAFQM